MRTLAAGGSRRHANQLFPQTLARLLQREVRVGREHVPCAALDLRAQFTEGLAAGALVTLDEREDDLRAERPA
jgi:hypothetical protein